jgi:hypothetical protein
MRASRLPLYAILGAVLIIAAWAHSFWKITTVSYRWGPPSKQNEFSIVTSSGEIRICAGQPYLSTYELHSGISWTGVKFWQYTLSPEKREIDLSPASIKRGISIGPQLEINYYLIFLLYIAYWVILLTRLPRRRKSHPTPPLPNRAE